MTKRYHTLAIRCDGVWTPEFGSYDRNDVAYEREEEREHGTPARDLRIITTGDKQAEIDAGIAALNAEG